MDEETSWDGTRILTEVGHKTRIYNIQTSVGNIGKYKTRIQVKTEKSPSTKRQFQDMAQEPNGLSGETLTLTLTWPIFDYSTCSYGPLLGISTEDHSVASVWFSALPSWQKFWETYIKTLSWKKFTNRVRWWCGKEGKAGSNEARDKVKRKPGERKKWSRK